MHAKSKDKSDMNTQENFLCPVCPQREDCSLLCEVDGYAIYRCRHCGADFVSPMPDNETLKTYYDREQWFEGGERGGYKHYDEQTSSSVAMIKPILEEYGDKQGLSILDVGCGYGTHLGVAADLGWKCFGVELSNHAHGVAQRRLEGRAYIVESVADLIPHAFDVVLLLDVIEHLPNPYVLLFSLFSIGAITPQTRLIISTPNAGSLEAEENPAGWVYRHPPSHLVYYRAETLRFFLERLHFTNIDIQGTHPLCSDTGKSLTFADYGGLMAIACGSDFAEFMHERYVPGTWSKIAEYEHLPRYELAKNAVCGKKVLDFGCGTGYGSAMLAGYAEKVVGLDIDVPAIEWAKTSHPYHNLEFYRCDDLGASLPAASFDVAVCFEMIEHVDFNTQKATLASIARLLKEDGLLIISTPNPDVTCLYGENPYHLREMSRNEFYELLATYFPHVHILNQRIRQSITFEMENAALTKVPYILKQDDHDSIPPLAYIAFCAKKILPEPEPALVFDNSLNFILEFMGQERKNYMIRNMAYDYSNQFGQAKKELYAYRDQAEEFSRQMKELQSNIAVTIQAYEKQAQEHSQLIAYQAGELNSIKRLLIRLVNKLIGRS